MNYFKPGQSLNLVPQGHLLRSVYGNFFLAI